MQRDGGTPPAPRPDGKGRGGGGLESAEQAINDLEDVIPVNQGRLAAYEVGKQIGSGKFSVVFRARAPDGKNVALKKIQIFDIMDAKSRNKCLREVRMLQTISQHVNLVEYLDAFIENNELHIVFEWAENGDLKRLLRKTNSIMEERQVWAFFVQISGAIAHMHEQRMMHRDIKPANIFVSGTNVLKMGDLGLGRVFSNESVEAFSKVGTPLYMSPEVLHGQGYDYKSDVWSLGCMLYELSTLKSPFEGPNQTLYDIFKRINNGEYEPLPETFSQELRNLVTRMLLNDPKRRPTAQEAFTYAKMACEAFNEKPSAYTMMLNIVDKCQLLDYERNLQVPEGLPPLNRIFFTTDDKSPQELKIRYFTLLTLWLLGLNGCNVERKGNFASVDGTPIDASGGDASLSSSVLINACHSLDVGRDVAPVRVRAGSGEAVCSLLDALLTRTLEATDFRFGAMKQGRAGQGGGDGDDEYLENDDGDEEDAVGWWERQAGDSDGEDGDGGDGDGVGCDGHEAGAGHPSASYAEAEAGTGGWATNSDGGWRERLDARMQAIKDWRDVWKGAEHPLGIIGKRAGEEAGLLKGREKMVNDAVGSGRGGLGQELEGVQEKLEAVTRECDEARQSFESAKASHESVMRELEESREVMEEAEREVNDSSGVARLKSAIKTLRRDAARLGLELQVAMHRRTLVWESERQRSHNRFLRRAAGSADTDDDDDGGGGDDD